MLKVDMQEGKNHPKELPEFGFEKQGRKAVGLFLCILKKYFSTGWCDILDSDF